MLNKLVQFFRVPELRRRILIVILLLIATRAITRIPLPGVDVVKFKTNLETAGSLFSINQALSGNLFSYLNLMTGGALDKLSIGMLGVSPYITATIILQLLMMIFPKLKEIYYEDGAIGRRKFQRLGRYLTVPLGFIQGYAFLRYLISQGGGIILSLTLPELVFNTLLITAGSLIMLWLGELISEQKMGDGISLIIFAGIVSALPSSLTFLWYQFTKGVIRIDTLALLLALALGVIAAVVMVSEGQRNVSVSYAKRIRGSRVYGGASTYLPLRLNQAGVIPIIFAISILMLPQYIGLGLRAISAPWALTTANFIDSVLSNVAWHSLLYFVLVFLFTYFYTFIVFDPAEISKNLQRNGGFIQGIRPGTPTAEYLSSIITKLTFFGALFLGLIAVMPSLVQKFASVANLTIGGTGLLIVVSVAIETAKQIDSELKIREYEGI